MVTTRKRRPQAVIGTSSSSNLGSAPNASVGMHVKSFDGTRVQGKKVEKGVSGRAPAASLGSGGGSHRSIGQTFKVNPANGTLSLSLPLDVAQGRSDFRPDLSLSYDSGSGNGPFGIGWALSTHSIIRKTSKHVPTYDKSDVFIFAGVEDLVPVQADGTKQIGDYLIQKFVPRVEGDRFRIERYTSVKDANDIYWRSITGDNTTTVFGRSDESRIFDVDANGRKRIFSWLVSESFDAHGNAIKYMYKAENSDGLEDCEAHAVYEAHRTPLSRQRMKYLKAIQYGNRTPNRDLVLWSPLDINSLDFMFEVIFDYGEHDQSVPTTAEPSNWSLREDAFSSYNSGFEMRTYRLVRRILVFHHMPEKLGRKDFLAKSFILSYAEKQTGSFLRSAQMYGHAANGDASCKAQSWAPHVFEYSAAPSVRNLPLQKIEGSKLLGSPSTNGPWTEWIDLDGEGSPGILVLQDGAWLYQHNELALQSDDIDVFGPTRIVNSHPNLAMEDYFYFEDLNRSGNLDIVSLGYEGILEGFTERLNKGWTDHEKFTSVPNSNISTPAMRRLDLTGDGLQDLLWSNNESNAIIWQQCLAKDGFSEERKVFSSDTTPLLESGDEGTMVYTSDMSGDGLTDIVHVSNGSVTYWPNLGHGNFGQKVTMGNPPRFDTDDQFTHGRIRLVDVDGSGTTDLIYFSAGGRAKVYYNHAGNSWSSSHKILNFPPVDDLSSVFAMDLRGTGTSCLCWTGPTVADSCANSLFYLDLMKGKKPHLLTKYSNGLGLSTTVSYRPSTWFYLNDLSQGRAWKTKLSFPVQCVERLHQIDEFSSTAATTRYAYHDGFNDPTEREFRGFGMVEQWDTEDFDTSGNKPFARPPIHKKMWYHTGAREIASTPSLAVSPPQLMHSELPENMTANEVPEVCRALKGVQLRTEIFSDDGSAKAHLPYQVTESQYIVARVQAPDMASRVPGVYRVSPRETLTSHFERDVDDPRQEHHLTLHINDWGDVVKSANIVYGKERSHLSDPADRSKQEEPIFMYIETDQTNAVEDENSYRKPKSCGERQFRIVGYPLKGLVDFKSIAGDDCRILSRAPEIAVDVTDYPQGSIAKKLIKESRTEYLNDNLSKRLPRGSLEAFSVVDQTFALAMTPSLLRKAYGDHLIVEGRSVTELMTAGGYVDLEFDGRWWSPSVKASYSKNEESELQAARKSFFLPTVSIDQFGNKSLTIYDEMCLLPQQSLDALSCSTSFSNNYVHLSPSQITDLNGNRVQYCFDTLGTAVGVAHLGKVDEQIGDSLDGFQNVLDHTKIISFLQDPLRMAPILLANAGIRKIYNPERICTRNAETVPAFEATITRDKHFREEDAKIMVEIIYLDGHGEPLQTVTLVDQKEKASQWRVSGWEIRDNKGTPVRKFQPCIKPSHLFVSQVNTKSPSTTILLDPLERPIGTLHADFSWEKTELNSWSQAFYDAGDTILLDPFSDPVVGPTFRALETAEPDLRSSTWHSSRLSAKARSFSKWEIQAASKSAAYSNSPTIKHYDALSRTFLTIADSGRRDISSRTVYDVCGNPAAVMDARGRIVERACFDYHGRPLVSVGMDSAERWSIQDCQGKKLFDWNSRGIHSRFVYDGLRRGTEIWKRRRANEALTNKICYGKVEDGAAAYRKNQLGEMTQLYDQSGMQCKTEFDFKGNCVSTFKQFAEEFNSILDWNDPETPLQAEKFTSTSHYDALNRAIESTNPDGCATKRDFNLSERLETVDWRRSRTSIWERYISNISYAPDLEPLCIDYGNGTQTSYLYDEKTRKVTNTTIRRDSTVLEDSTFTYDCIGQISHVENAAQKSVYFDNNVIDASRDFTYDSVGQLVRAEGRELLDPSHGGGQSLLPYQSTPSFGRRVLPGDGHSMCRYVESYDYTKTGNILSMRHEAGDGATVSGWTREYFYEEPSLLESGTSSDRLSRTKVGRATETYRYDQNSAGKQGCMTSMPGYSSLTWDCDDKLRSSSTQITREGSPETTWYVYDDNGQRVRKVTVSSAGSNSSTPRKMKETLYLPDLEIFRTFDGDGVSIKSEKLTSHVNGVSRIALVEDGLVRYQVDEGLELDDHGNVVSYEEYSPFGATTYVACGRNIDAPSKYRYASYERDVETGLFHCGERYYASWIGRWISTDPIGTDDDLNVYRYVSNNPVNFDDPGGTCLKAKSTPTKTDDPKKMTSIQKENGRNKIKVFPAPSDGNAPVNDNPNSSVASSKPNHAHRMLTSAIERGKADQIPRRSTLQLPPNDNENKNPFNKTGIYKKLANQYSANNGSKETGKETKFELFQTPDSDQGKIGPNELTIGDFSYEKKHARPSPQECL